KKREREGDRKRETFRLLRQREREMPSKVFEGADQQPAVSWKDVSLFRQLLLCTCGKKDGHTGAVCVCVSVVVCVCVCVPGCEGGREKGELAHLASATDGHNHLLPAPPLPI